MTTKSNFYKKIADFLTKYFENAGKLQLTLDGTYYRDGDIYSVSQIRG
jgi:hypothetical protein